MTSDVSKGGIHSEAIYQRDYYIVGANIYVLYIPTFLRSNGRNGNGFAYFLFCSSIILHFRINLERKD